MFPPRLQLVHRRLLIGNVSFTREDFGSNAHRFFNYGMLFIISLNGNSVRIIVELSFTTHVANLKIYAGNRKKIERMKL
jgi:hypothetical protein